MFWEKKLENWVDHIRQQSRATLPLRLRLWDGRQYDFGSQSPRVTISIPDVAAVAYLLRPSLANLGKAYVEGMIQVEGRITEIIGVANALAAGTLKGHRPVRWRHNPFRHTRRRDAESIRYHYDVSNAFYQAFLDENMVYSCAYFERGDEDLGTAQQRKIDHILTKIAVRPGDTLLDIGCGWGALVMRAASHYGARCVGVTLSKNQQALAQERVERAGLSDRVEIRLQDYRDVTGTFDRITSVGMFEHVGVRNLPAYFGRINELLADDGLAMNHGITTTHVDNGETAYGGGEFIDTYVFPQGELPHIGNVLRAMQVGGLEALDVENLRRHYARTCSLWADNFEANAQRIRNLVDEKRFRIWRIYLAGCAYAFSRDWISLNQIVCGKAGRDAGKLPWSRRYMYETNP
jgi:cyclopropane-fatty-acyl-phospholipid synthase